MGLVWDVEVEEARASPREVGGAAREMENKVEAHIFGGKVGISNKWREI